MHTFTKTLLSLATATVALAVISSCSSATTTATPTPTPVVEAPWLLDFSGAVNTTDWTNGPGYHNTEAAASYPALTIVSTAAQAYRSMVYAKGGTGTTAWIDGTDATKPLYAATKELKFSLVDTGFDTGDSHVLLNFTNQDLSKLGNYKGVMFAVRVPHFSATDYVKNTGFTVLLRKNENNNNNTAVYAANLGGDDDTAGTITTTDGSQNDWLYWGNENLFVFKVPFDFFTVPGWWSAGQEPSSAATIAAALTAGVVFNEVDFDFRYNRAGSAYTDNVQYTGYISNIGLY